MANGFIFTYYKSEVINVVDGELWPIRSRNSWLTGYSGRVRKQVQNSGQEIWTIRRRLFWGQQPQKWRLLPERPRLSSESSISSLSNTAKSALSNTTKKFVLFLEIRTVLCRPFWGQQPQKRRLLPKQEMKSCTWIYIEYNLNIYFYRPTQVNFFCRLRCRSCWSYFQRSP